MQTVCGKFVPDAHRIIMQEIKRRHEIKCCACNGLAHVPTLHIDPTTGAPWFDCDLCGIEIDHAFA